jgi:hypothetical protein
MHVCVLFVSAGKPVMEGKAVLFKKFADIDAFDLEVACDDPVKLVELLVALEPTFGGINLEDIKVHGCAVLHSVHVVLIAPWLVVVLFLGVSIKKKSRLFWKFGHNNDLQSEDSVVVEDAHVCAAGVCTPPCHA